MILTTNLSQALIQLLETEDAPVDAIEVGPWFTVEEVRQYQEKLPDWDFYFRPSNWTSRMALSSKSMCRLNTYLHMTQSPWASVHITMLPPEYVWIAMRYGLYLPSPPNRYIVDRFIKQVKKLQSKVDVPVILENMPAFPTKKYMFETRSDLICRILKETECKFLLDLSHARVGATESVSRYDVVIEMAEIPSLQTGRLILRTFSPNDAQIVCDFAG